MDGFDHGDCIKYNLQSEAEGHPCLRARNSSLILGLNNPGQSTSGGILNLEMQVHSSAIPFQILVDRQRKSLRHVGDL